MNAEYLFFEGVATTVVPATRSSHAWRLSGASEPVEPVGEFIRDVLNGAGLSDRSYRGRALQRRLPACLRYLRSTTVEEARRKLEAQPERARALLAIVLLGVSEFFRDRAVFDQIRDRVLPELLAGCAPLRVWSAACSAGQELYSIAMLLAESGRLPDCELLGTDCRPDAIERARRGEFGFEELAPLEPRWRESFFNRAREGGVAIPRLRQGIRWRVGNLLTATEPGPWHLVLWRNMAIYLEPAAANDIWERLWSELAPGGFLVTGKADQPPPGLPLVRVSACVYQKRRSNP